MNDATQPFPRFLIVILVAAILTLLSGGLWFYRSQKQAVQQEIAEELMAVARLKADQIASWRTERLGDGAVLKESPFFLQGVTRFLTDRRDEDARQILVRFQSLKTHYRYDDVMLVDPNGRKLLSLHAQNDFHPDYLDVLEKALHSGSPTFTELHVAVPKPHPHIGLVVPIFGGPDHGARPLGAVVLMNNASSFLYPLIQSWPTPSRSAETVLVRRDGQDVLFLNSLRYQPESALNLRIPLSRTEVPAVKAVLGHQGVFEGKDYRGVDVVSVVLPVPDSPWFVVSKQDAEEVYGEWNLRAVLILSLFAALMAGVVVLGLVGWQRSQKAHYQRMYHAEARLRANVERHSVTLKAIGDAVMATDAAGRVELLNPVAEALTGWRETEAHGRPLTEVFRIINEMTRQPVEDPVQKVLREGVVVGLANHTLLIAKDGSERPIADSGAPIFNTRGEIIGVVLVFRDQTEERRHQRLYEIRLDLLEYAQKHHVDAVLSKTLDHIGLFVQSPIGFYSFLEDDEENIVPRQWSTRTLEESHRAEGLAQPCAIDQAGGWRECVREGKPVVHNQHAALPHKKNPPPWHPRLIRELLVPVIRQGRVVAVLGMGNKPTEYTEKDAETLAYLADVTWQLIQQKRAEEALRKSEEKYRSLTSDVLDSSEVGIFILDPEFKVVWINRAMERYFGLRREDVVGRDKRHLIRQRIMTIFEDPRTFAAKVFATYDDNSYVENFECHVLAGDRCEERWLQHWSQPIRSGLYAGGRIEHYYDISRRKCQEEEICRRERRSARQRTALAQLALDPAIVEGDVSPALDHVTRVMCETMEVCRASIWRLAEDRSQLCCLSLFEAARQVHSAGAVLDARTFPAYFSALTVENRIHAQDAQNDPRARELWESYLKPAGVVSLLDVGIIIDGRLFGVACFEHVGEPRKWHADEESFAGTCAAIVAQIFTNAERREVEVEREKLQAQLLHAQKMEAVGRLAGGVAHDFNNMLGVILGYVELARQKVGSDEGLLEDLDEIMTAARRSADITRQLLAFARKQTVAPRVLDLNDTVEGMLRMLRRLIGENIDLKWLPEGKLWPVRIDPSQVDQILANLCVNARDAIGGVGMITIETKNVLFDQAYGVNRPDVAPGEYVLLAVSDNGRGMNPETLANLFEPFFTTKEMGRGTGLGLATVYGIVKQNDGFIDVHSEPNNGTLFKVYLPRNAHPVEAADVSMHEGPVSGGGETVLVVEDEVAVLDMAGRMLKGLGYTVLSAGSPAEAVALAEGYEGRIDLLITDVVMPEMNGRDLAVRLQTLYPALKVLFMSGYPAEVMAHRSILDEGARFLQKPFSRKGLAVKVRETLD